MTYRRLLFSTAAALALTVAGSTSGYAADPSAEAVVETYADIAHAMYEDSHKSAIELKAAMHAQHDVGVAIRQRTEAAVAARYAHAGTASIGILLFP